MRTQLTNIRDRWNEARLRKSAVFGIAIGVVILTIYLGFSQAGWVTNTRANRMADLKSQDVLIERLAPICVAQFDQDPQRTQKLDELKLLTSTGQRTRYVIDQSWAIIPGEIEADDDVAAKCAQQIISIAETSP